VFLPCQDHGVAEIWSQSEVDKVVDVYFSMLELELDGQAYTKSLFREQVMAGIDRSKGSVEYKLQNVSAVLAEIGALFIDGYKPARNYQALLRSRVVERFEDASALRQKTLRAVGSPMTGPVPELGDRSAVPDVAARAAGGAYPRRGVKVVDYQALEAQNHAPGARW
jgi:hypothetical protein